MNELIERCRELIDLHDSMMKNPGEDPIEAILRWSETIEALRAAVEKAETE